MMKDVFELVPTHASKQAGYRECQTLCLVVAQMAALKLRGVAGLPVQIPKPKSRAVLGDRARGERDMRSAASGDEMGPTHAERRGEGAAEREGEG